MVLVPLLMLSFVRIWTYTQSSLWIGTWWSICDALMSWRGVKAFERWSTILSCSPLRSSSLSPGLVSWWNYRTLNVLRTWGGCLMRRELVISNSTSHQSFRVWVKRELIFLCSNNQEYNMGKPCTYPFGMQATTLDQYPFKNSWKDHCSVHVHNPYCLHMAEVEWRKSLRKYVLRQQIIKTYHDCCWGRVNGGTWIFRV